MFSRGQFRKPRGAYQRRPFGTVGVVRQSAAALPPPSASQNQIDVVEHLLPQAKVLPEIQNVKLVASFSWKDTNHAASTLLVPGKPPRWQPPSAPQSLREDQGVYFRDVNSARHPTFPTEPAVRAILQEDAEHSLLDCDVFACGNTYGCLVSFANGEDRTFRFGVERVGSTTFFVRKTNTPRETIDGVRGYGHTFPEAYTVWESDVRGSASHQRIIKYDFMDLKVMLRSECDGYLPDRLQRAEPTLQSAAHQDTTQDSDFNATFPALEPSLHKQESADAQSFEILPAGRAIPQNAIFDLKTRSQKAKERLSNDLEEFYPRLWANQTPNFILAFHDKGTFDNANIQIKDVREEVLDWQSRNSVVLQRFAALLKKLIEVSSTEAGARFEVRRTGMGPLELWSENPGWSALPDDLKIQLEGLQGDLGKSGENGDKNDDSEEGEEGGVTLGQKSSPGDEIERDDAEYIKF